MDEDEYNHIVELAEQGEYIDFEIPEDAPEGKRVSDDILGLEEENDMDPVGLDDLNELFEEV